MCSRCNVLQMEMWLECIEGTLCQHWPGGTSIYSYAVFSMMRRCEFKGDTRVIPVPVPLKDSQTIASFIQPINDIELLRATGNAANEIGIYDTRREPPAPSLA